MRLDLPREPDERPENAIFPEMKDWPVATAPASGRGPLAGLRVLDLSRILSGPYATMTLADLGADVVKIEQPGSGDDTREWGPPFQGSESAYFLSVNRNKRSLALDLKSEAGNMIVRRLARGADVLLENFRPGTAERLGLGYALLSDDNPALIYASISGYGQTGPMRDEPGYDAIAQALSGVMSITGEADGPPVRVGVSSADLGAGMWAVIGILAALAGRSHTGRGQWVDVSLLDGQVAWLSYVAAGFFATGEVPARYGSAHPTIVPYQALRTADGNLMVAVGNDALWQRFAAAVGLADLADDPRFAGNPDRVRHRAELITILEDVLVSRPSEYWAQKLSEAGVPAGPINTVDQALAHPQVLARGMVRELDHPTIGRLRTIGCPIKLSADPPVPPTPPPTLGQDTDGLLRELGLVETEIQWLRADGVIR